MLDKGEDVLLKIATVSLSRLFYGNFLLFRGSFKVLAKSRVVTSVATAK